MTTDRGFSIHRLSRLLLLLLLGVSVACGLHATVNGWLRIHIRHQLDYEEGNVLNAAVLINHGHTPYPDPHGWPVVISPYGPVPYCLAAIPVHFQGPNFAGPRALILLSTLLCGLFVGLIVQGATKSATAGVISGALFVSHSLVQYWMVILRVDLVGLALTLAGLWLFLRFPHHRLAAVLLFTAAIFTKPTFIAAPAACFVFLLLKREHRKAAVFAASGVGLIVALFLAMQWQTHGAFAFDIFQTHPDSWQFSHYQQMFRYLLLGDPPLVVIALVGFGSSLWRRDFSVIILYAIFALLATFTAGKLGSNDNHLLELTAVICIFAATAIFQWSKSTTAASLSATAVCLLLSLWLIVQVRFIPTNIPQRGCTPAYDLVEQWPGQHLLSEDVGALVLGNKPVWVSNPFVYGQLAKAGKWSGNQLTDRIRSQWFDLILLSEDANQYTDRWTPEMLGDIKQNYHLAERFACEGAKAAYVPNREPNAQKVREK